MDGIEKGLVTLRGIGEAMGESISQQDIVIDAIDDKVRNHTRAACARRLLNIRLICGDLDAVQMTKVTEVLKTNNMKLKGLVTQVQSILPAIDGLAAMFQPDVADMSVLHGVISAEQMRTSRNFCLDVVLICIVLALGLYMYELFKK